ncbi:hypothetical protein G4B88_000306 [Cannabis sativa]|uniref:Uncharacterized protein n=1 Tax=Cannabis sativa TaxID=3483 RepID=A0A7J6DVB6_CANSA|nr:hypothetical protein G4B88_000306 [Cannabis sativa]
MVSGIARGLLYLDEACTSLIIHCVIAQQCHIEFRFGKAIDALNDKRKACEVTPNLQGQLKGGAAGATPKAPTQAQKIL